MKRLLPQSVNGRVFFALVFTVIFINLTSLFFYVVFRDEAAASAAASQAADQIIVIRRLVERAPNNAEKGDLIRRLSSPLINLRLTPRPIVEQSDSQYASQVVLKKLLREFPKGSDIRVDSRIDLRGFQTDSMPLDEAIRRSITESARPDNDPATAPTQEEQHLAPGQQQGPRPFIQRLLDRQSQRMMAMRGGLPGLDEALFNVSIKVDDKQAQWFNARVLLNLGEPQTQYVPFLWLTAVSVLIGAIAWWGVNKATNPLSVFAYAAERLGVDVNAEPMHEDGPSEVRRAAHAFNTMQTRIKRFIQDRTQMLAAISHDLRTPITRLRLRAEFVDDDVQRKKMLSDLDEMEAMIAATLTFARDDAANEPVAHVDVAAIIASLCGDQRAAGRTVSYSGPDSFELVARPLALKRAINNFVDNAVKYGKSAHVSLVPGAEELTVCIDDQGPGIPPGEKERVFAPFIRLESSRSRETGGTGLGLTIARNAIRSMGGDVELINRHEGGLRVKVTLPVAQEEMLAAAAE